MGHFIDYCQGFKKLVKNMIQNGWISFEEKVVNIAYLQEVLGLLNRITQA